MSTEVEIAKLEWRIIQAAVGRVEALKELGEVMILPHRTPPIETEIRNLLDRKERAEREENKAVDALIAVRAKAEAKGPTPIGSPN